VVTLIGPSATRTISFAAPPVNDLRHGVIGVKHGRLRVMMLEKTQAPHGYKQGDEFTVWFEELSDSRSAIWLVPEDMVKKIRA
jgi:hypothetical protein